MAAALALTVLTVAESGPAAAAACSLTSPAVRSVATAAGTPRVRNLLSSRRDLARAKVTSLASRRAGSRSWASKASATATVAVTGRARVTSIATSRVTLTAHVLCSGAARVVTVQHAGTGAAASSGQAQVTTTARGAGQASATTRTTSRASAKKLATSRALAAGTATATASSRGLARRRAAATSLSVARARSVAAARKASFAALNLALQSLGAGPVASPSPPPGSPPTGSAPTATVPTAAVPAYPANGTFDYQIGGPYAPLAGVTIVDRDRTASPVAGKYNVCYINAFQSQPGESAAWGSLLLRTSSGGLVQDPGWPGEYVVDTRQAAAVAAFVGTWIRGCAAKGFQAVELDNLDSDTRSGGLLTAANNLDVFRRLVAVGHAAGVAVAQKNTVALSAQAKAAGADFAIAEECQVYAECGGYAAVYGTSWVEIEYTDSAYSAACSARGATTSVIRRDVQVAPVGSSGYVYSSC